MVGAWFLFFRNQGDSAYDNSRQPALALRDVLNNDKDSDSDGLKDWEETLWKTDPNNPDSDGDGMSDGEEVRNNRDPLIPGAGDVKTVEVVKSDLRESLGKSVNLTEVFTSAFAGSLGPQISTGDLKSISPDDLKNIKDYLPNPENILGNLPKVAARDLKTSSANDSASVKKYFNDFYEQVYDNVFHKLTVSDIGQLLNFSKSGNPNDLAPIEDIMAVFEESIAVIKSLPVPEGYEEFPIGEIDFFMQMKRADEFLRNANKDPLAALIVLQPRILMEEKLNKFHNDFKAKLFQEGIIFEASDKGSKLFR